MVTAIYTAISIAHIILGIFILVKRKFMINQLQFNLLHFSFITFNLFVVCNRNKTLGIFMVISFVILSMVSTFQGRYTVFGFSSNTVLGVLKEILDEEGIFYYEEERYLKLEDYGHKSIFYRKSWDSVEIILKEIRDLPLYETIKNKLKSKIQEIDEKLFPTNGVFYLVGGIGLIILILFLEYLARR